MSGSREDIDKKVTKRSSSTDIEIALSHAKEGTESKKQKIDEEQAKKSKAQAKLQTGIKNKVLYEICDAINEGADVTFTTYTDACEAHLYMGRKEIEKDLQKKIKGNKSIINSERVLSNDDLEEVKKFKLNLERNSSDNDLRKEVSTLFSAIEKKLPKETEPKINENTTDVDNNNIRNPSNS